MRTSLLFVSIFISTISFGQVGINTDTPKSTLEISGKASTSPDYSTTIDGLLIPRVSRLRAQNMSDNIEESTLIYVNDISDGSLTGKAQLIDVVGFYFFKDGKWSKLEPPTGSQASITADNGLTKYGSNIQLGGTLIEPVTTIQTSAQNTLAITNLQEGDLKTNNILIIDPVTGVLQKTEDITDELSIPVPVVLSLETTQTNFLNSVSSGNTGDQSIPNFKVIKNAIDGFDASNINGTNPSVTLPKGVYQITFIYEARHNATSCNLASYYVPFPDENSTISKIYTTSAFNQGANSVHGGSIIYTTILPNGATWDLKFGRGESGNCYGNGMTLLRNSTQITIYKLGEPS